MKESEKESLSNYVKYINNKEVTTKEQETIAILCKATLDKPVIIALNIKKEIVKDLGAIYDKIALIISDEDKRLEIAQMFANLDIKIRENL